MSADTAPAEDRLCDLPEGRAPWTRRDWWVMAGLFLAAGVTRVPLWPRLVINPDGAGFVWGLDKFNLVAQHPHPPGCLPFLLLGKVVHAAGLSGNVSLLLVSTGFGALACVALYALGTALFGARVGLAAAVLLLFENNSWLGALTPLSHTAGMFWAVAALGAAYATRRGARQWLWVSALCLGIGFGFRVDVALAAGLIWLWTIRGEGWARVVGAAVLAGGIALAWGPLTGLMPGGPAAYHRAMTAHLRENYLPQTILPALHLGLRGVVAYLQDSLARWFIFVFGGSSHLSVLAWVPLGLYAWGRTLRPNLIGRDYRVQLLVGWIAPLVIFHLLIYMGVRLYAAAYAAPFMLLGGLGAYFLSRDWGALGPRRRADRALIVIVALASLLNIAVFMSSSVADVRAEVRALAARVKYIQSQPADQTVLVQSDIQGDDRCVFYYTQAYAQYIPYQTMHGAPLSLSPPSPVYLPPAVRQVIFTNPAARVPGPATVVKVGAGASLKVRPLAPEERYMFFGPEGVWFGRTAEAGG